MAFSHFPVIASVGGLFGNPKYRVNLHYHILFLVICSVSSCEASFRILPYTVQAKCPGYVHGSGRWQYE